MGVDCLMVIYSFAGSGGSTGGAIGSTTHFSHVDYANPVTEASAATATIKVEKNVGGSGASEGDVKITTEANETGTIIIIGQPKRS